MPQINKEKLPSNRKCARVSGAYSWIRVRRETLVKLQLLKRKKRCKSLNEVIRKLMEGGN